MQVVQKGEVYATQFHPEKSGQVGLDILDNFLGGVSQIASHGASQDAVDATPQSSPAGEQLADHHSNPSPIDSGWTSCSSDASCHDNCIL